MYGLVNKAVQKFVTEEHGEENWNIIKEKAGVSEVAFVSMQTYPDNITFNLVGAASEHFGIDANDILIAFGGYWIKFAMNEGYGHLIDLAGGNLPDFLRNLNNMHTHIAQSYDKLRPPSFLCEDIDESTFRLTYTSEREGLAMFVKGLLLGLGEKFGVTIDIDYRGEIQSDAYSHLFIVKYS